MSAFIHLFHIFVVGALFLYVGIRQKKIPTLLFPVLLGLGVFIILYHAYKAYTKINSGKSAWINYIHLFFVGPLLIIIGYNGVETSRKYYELLLMAGFASIGYHSYYLLQK
jgi:Na+-transporting methylmalonyl-CoA/oxaloacetate decarboxylase beta subunit